MDDKQAQVQAARDALMEPEWWKAHGFNQQPLCVIAEGCVIDTPEKAALIAEAIEALIAWHSTSGIDRGDRLRNAAKALWEMREGSR